MTFLFLLIYLKQKHLVKLFNFIRKYEIIILDESETTLNNLFNNEKIKDNAIVCWNIFIRVLKEAQPIIILDALLTNTNIDFKQTVRTDDLNI